MPRRSFAQYHHQHKRESKPMISTESASPGKRLSSGDRESFLKLSLEASELRYRRLFETAQDGILILDANTGKIIDVNPFLLDLLDYPFEDIIGLRLWEIGQFKDIAANQAAFETLQRNEYIRYEDLPLCSKAGKEIHVEFISNVYFVGSDKVIQCNIRDISARSVVDEASHGRLAALELANKSKDDLLADAGKLEQILSNLIGNALKFTPIGGRILIVTRNENDKLAIEVSDTGIGISAEALGRIFSPFQQGDSSIHPRFGGLGLGLSIARTLTTAHRGTLEVKSGGLGKGANFTLRFKVDDSAPPAREEAPLVAAKKAA